MGKILLAFCLFLPMVATAGLIAPDGNEWEMRGMNQNYFQHSIDAASDTGWIWASADQFASSGLADELLTGDDLNAFEGSCDGVGPACDAYLNETLRPRPIVIFSRFGADGSTPPFNEADSFYQTIVFTPVTTIYRLSFRPTGTVPEPYTLGLLMLGISGLSLVRRAKLGT